jgi:hypothetical protein
VPTDLILSSPYLLIQSVDYSAAGTYTIRQTTTIDATSISEETDFEFVLVDPCIDNTLVPADITSV